jgi:hypothetical protein
MHDTTDGAGAPSAETFRLMYLSHDLIDPEDSKRALGALFSQARTNNKKRNITGALLVTGETFIQTLEGDEQVVRAVYDRICQDKRHDGVQLLETGTVPERVFGHWSMARVSEDGEPDIPLIAHTDGISPAAGRRISPAAAQVLDTMREAAGRVAAS